MTIERNYVKGNKIVAIDLHNHHKAKLYEMCSSIIENNNPNANVYLLENFIKIPKQTPNAIGYNDIHWFELCTTHLCFHICDNPLEYLKYCIDYSMLVDKGKWKHPIDYIYDEYDKIRDLFLNVYNTRLAKPKPKPLFKKSTLKDVPKEMEIIEPEKFKKCGFGYNEYDF